MKTSLLIVVGIAIGLITIGFVFAINSPPTKDANQFKYDKLCGTQFWTETKGKPNQLYVKSVIIEQLKQRVGWQVSPDHITFYYAAGEFVVTIPGDWKENSPVITVVNETLEGIDEIVRVKENLIICA